MGNVVHGIIARHVLLLQEEGGVAFALSKYRDKHIGTCDFFAARRLHMDHSPLYHPLETCRGLCLLRGLPNKICQLIVNIIREIITQFIKINATSTQDGNSVLVLRQRQQQMFKRRIFLPPFCGERQGTVEGFF
jgi:hypothetical protein